MALPNDGRLTTDHLPTVTLADGSKVQTGTAARLSLTIKDYNMLPAEATAEREELLRQMETAIAPLHKVGLLELFSPKEWIGDESNPGRAAFGQLYSEWLACSSDDQQTEAGGLSTVVARKLNLEDDTREQSAVLGANYEGGKCVDHVAAG